MTPLHLPTAYFIAGILYLIMPISVWLMLRKRQELSNTLWCLGGLAFGLSLILLGMRGKWPDALTYGVAIWLLVLEPLLRVGAVRHILKRPVWVTGLLALSLVHIAVYAVLHLILDNASLRFVWSSLGAAAALAWLALLARDVDRRDRSISAQWIFFCYLALAAVLIIRIPGVLLGLSEPTALIADPLSNVLIFLGVVTAIVGNIGFLGMFIERMNKDALESAKVQARQDESTRLSEQIAQLDRRRSVGEISASLAHELSQPLTNIYLIADRMEMALQQRQDASLNNYFEDLNRNTQKAGDILGRIRTFIQSKNTHFERVELNQVITDVSALIHDLAYNESVELQVLFPPQGLAVWADPVQLSQIFMNVIRNAIQATHGQPLRQLRIRVWREGKMAHITLTDNGPGLPAEALSQAGTAFFTTKTEGLGVGLYISKSIAHQHGGSLSIGNSPMGGAVVALQLPAVD
ncbi:sensor histidine kinase [Limnohabitans sp.]|jgi:signal transduction histidine kinase|uniref:sensor histidine kinase n=1 Tax=Limnohabitans sp. TaxID=1907725 RepID=UPI0037C076FB